LKNYQPFTYGDTIKLLSNFVKSAKNSDILAQDVKRNIHTYNYTYNCSFFNVGTEFHVAQM